MLLKAKSNPETTSNALSDGTTASHNKGYFMHILIIFANEQDQFMILLLNYMIFHVLVVILLLSLMGEATVPAVCIFIAEFNCH